jgi:arginine deiminase
MKKIVLFLVFVFIISGTAVSQMKRDRFDRAGSKIERLEKLKLIEALDLSEEATLRFFSRRTEHRKIMQSLQEDADNKILELEQAVQDQNIPDTELRKLLVEYFELEQKLVNERNSFISSLKDILTTRQQCRLIVFEKRFKQELRDVILRERQRKRN